VQQTTNGASAVGGLVVKTGRVGATTGRLALLPARLVARSWLGVAARRRLEAVPGDVLATPEAERAVDRVLAGPLPEAVARSLVEHRVIERVVGEALATADLERLVASALEHERTERLVEQVLASPALERLLTDALESRLTLELTDRMVRSPEFERVLARVLSGPEVRAALTHQTTTLAEEMAAGVRRRAIRLDAAAEAGPRRLLRRPPRAQVAPGEAPSVPYAGLATRGVGLAVDAALAQLIFLIGSALIGLVASLVGTLRPVWLVGALVGGGWALVLGTYFVAFWTVAGQTPGMRLMRLRMHDDTGAPPGLGRSLLRLIGLALSIVFLFAGFLPALVDDRRRALHDLLAGTVVVYGEHAPLPAGESVAAAARAEEGAKAGQRSPSHVREP